MPTIEQLTAERDEAREWVRRLQQTTQTLTCVYCGKEYPPGSPTHGSEVLTEHIRQCDKHPMRAVEQSRDKLRVALVSLVGVDGKEELTEMAKAMRELPAPQADKEASLYAIHVLLETL